MQVLGYITQNYTLFLVGAVIILLAVIGYYAEKTNFGQSKENQSKENDSTQSNNESNDIKNAELLDATISEEKEETNDLNVQPPNPNVDNDLAKPSIELILEGDLSQSNNSNYIVSENSNINQSTVDKLVSNDLSNVSNEVIDLEMSDSNVLQNEQLAFNEENMIQQSEDNFDIFSAELESLLPKKNIINTDLLSDIEDLELDRTQKIDLSGVPDLDDIELPKIMELSAEKEDIWKF